MQKQAEIEMETVSMSSLGFCRVQGVRLACWFLVGNDGMEETMEISILFEIAWELL